MKSMFAINVCLFGIVSAGFFKYRLFVKSKKININGLFIAFMVFVFLMKMEAI